ncbi:MAG TPA: SNF2-related protein, partial [Opitutaceae bacterium]
AVYIKPVAQDGKTVHQVQPLSGQATRLAKRLIVVDEVRPTSESEIPGKPGRKRRFIEPLEHDLLLYMDEVDPLSGPTAPGGVVKIKLPKDGSISREQLIRAHGVRVLSADPDQDKSTVSFQVAVRDIPRFRESIGGFVMEPRVRATLDKEIRDERVRLEKGRAIDQLVKYEDLEDQYGNINPDGPLKGLVPGDAGIQPGPWRVKALQKLANNSGRLFAAHHMGTGKTALAIMADQMMRNLKDAAGKQHPNQLRGKTAYLVPANKPADWYEEIKQFAGEVPTLLGASTLANALQIPKLPARGVNEKDETYRVRALAAWKERLATEPTLWNPFVDSSKRIVIGHEYFRDHEEALMLTGLFDGMVIDEAHKIVNDNELSRAVQRWSPRMKMFLPMSGTPVRNRLNVLPRIVELVSGGQVRLEDFEERYLLPSAILRALGVRNPPLTDLNPSRAAELMNIIGPYIDVATAADVKSKMMPAILVDENSPSHMIGQQARMYRAQMNKLTSKDRIALQQSALGIDEEKVLSDEAKRYVAAARNTANCPAYKVPDEREGLTYKAQQVRFDKQGKPSSVVEVEREFRLPSYTTMVGKGSQGWRGKWPTLADVTSERVEPGYYMALSERFETLMGVTYDSVAGKPIDKEILDAISKGTYVTPTGQEWNARVVNPDYGPEGMVSRGVIDETTGKISAVPFIYTDENGAAKHGEVPVGTRFIRDPRNKGSALYWHQKDWDHTGRFDATPETGTTGGDTGEVEETAAAVAEKPKKGKAREQQPLPGHENHDVNRSPERRIERAMFDAVVTHGNAKADALEEWMLNTLSTKSGVPNPENAQFILFGNRLGSSVRTLESKMRVMGYQDVNEALGHPEWSSEADKARRPRKYFVSFLSKGGTLGDRDMNSEVFRHKQDQFGNPTGPSMIVWRTLYGTTG